METTLTASFLAVTGIWLVTVLLPGPNFVATVHASLARSRRDGLLVVAGIALGTLVWAAASLAGLGLLFRAAGWLFVVVKTLGAAYLIVMGLRMVLARGGAAAAPARAGGAFRTGLLTDLSNPKAATFFTSLFAVAVPPGAPLWFQAALVGTVVAMAALWYGAVALVLSGGRAGALYRRAEAWIRRAAGALFVAFGVRLLADR
ncbi:MAG: LysE family transporter [Hyphomicrobiales bacterium]|nr:LysE family transporter [Hyphomicrobiales bacterium]MCP5370211.1 LysE family transporter [Hyphomicrobiales bacterium]